MSNIPGSFSFIQQESVQFNNPVSESSLSAIGSSINGLLSIVLPVGSIVHSMLTESQFQTQIGNTSTWVLADGRGVLGSTYNIVTGNSNIPDLRGIMMRGKNGSRSDGNQNPDGDLDLGTYTADRFLNHDHDGGNHTHATTEPIHYHTVQQGGFGSDNQTTTPGYGSNNSGTFGAKSTSGATTGLSINASGNIIDAQGGNDTAPKNVTVNILMRIN